MYPNDWDCNTAVRSMSFAERGLYVSLLNLQWRDGTIPDNLALLARILGVPESELMPLWTNVRLRFISTDTGLRNQRLQEEREKAELLQQKRSENGKLGGSVSKYKKPSLSEAQARASDCVCVSESTITSQVKQGTETTKNGEGESKGETRPSVADRTTWFDAEFWITGVVWQKIGYGAAKKAWLAKVHTHDTAAKLIDAAKQQGPAIVQHAHEHSHSVLHPATWINQDRWRDEIETSPGLFNGNPRKQPLESFEERHNRLRTEDFRKRMMKHVDVQ